MLTVISTEKTQTTQTATTSDSAKGAELLLSYMMWEQKFEGNAHDVLEDPIDVFLTAQGEKQLTLV